MATPIARRDFCLKTRYLYNMEYKECRTCGEYLSIESFYYYVSEKTGRKNLATPDCRECDKEKTNRRRSEERGDAGSQKVLRHPNTYKDKDQRDITFTFMKMMGWKFNEDNGVWYDDIKKTKDGEFIGVWAPTLKKKKRQLIFTEENPPLIHFKKPRTQNLLSEDAVNKILYDYYIEKMTYGEIGLKYDIKKISVESYIKYFVKLLSDDKESVKVKVDKVIPKAKTAITRKKHFSVKTNYDNIPTVVLSKFNPMFTPEVIREIQNDYFKGSLKFYEVVKKYEDYDAGKVAYIIRRTMKLIKMYKDANENKN
jgi:hypothetical protein